tara:strand:- start:731 stop:2359 length:1629 start_codon:yes stop_codon:yes gene_type:complete
MTFIKMLFVALISLNLYAQDMGSLGSAACEGLGPDCQENIVTESDLENPADKGTMKLLSAGAGLLYMGGILNGALTLPVFAGPGQNMCVSAGLGVAAHLIAFMRAKSNGKKIEAELQSIRDEALALQEKLESEGFEANKEFQIEVFDFYMRAMEKLVKVSQLRMKQHGQNQSLYSIVMAVGTAEAIIYALPPVPNWPMAKCGAIAAVTAGIALMLEKKGQKQAQKLMEQYQARWAVLAEIKARLMMATESLADIRGDTSAPDRTTIGSGSTNQPGRLAFGSDRDWEATPGGLSVTNYGCVNSAQEMDENCVCQANNSCYKSTATGWDQSRYGSAFSNAGLKGLIADMNSSFAGKSTDPSSLSMADINANAARAARLRDRLLKDYADKESKASKKNKLGAKIGLPSDKELADFLNTNFKKKDLDSMFSKFPSAFAGSDINIGPGTEKLLGDKAFDKNVVAKDGDFKGNEGAKAEEVDNSGVDFGLASDGSLAAFDPKNIVLPKDANFDYAANRNDIVENNQVSLWDIISHRYQLIYRQKGPEL